jgi:hypothetical protein
MSKKGTIYERTIARQLSEWWSDGRDSDWFWRIPGSGGRATRRGRRDQRTSGQYGDIEATNPKANSLLRLFTIEIKRGYNKFTPFDMIDKSDGAAVQTYESWIIQAIEASEYARTPLWMLISRRDQRNAVVCFPQNLLTRLASKECGSFHGLLAVSPRMQMTVQVRKTQQITLTCTVVMMKLDDFFLVVSPRDIRLLTEKPK